MKSLFTGGVQWPEIRWFVCSANTKFSKSSIKLPSPEMSSPAFLQFTSGSTSDPKGVMITHANLRHNLDIIVTNLKADESTIVVSWLPL